jgi:hypothetical protein
VTTPLPARKAREAGASRIMHPLEQGGSATAVPRPVPAIPVAPSRSVARTTEQNAFGVDVSRQRSKLVPMSTSDDARVLPRFHECFTAGWLHLRAFSLRTAKHFDSKNGAGARSTRDRLGLPEPWVRATPSGHSLPRPQTPACAGRREAGACSPPVNPRDGHHITSAGHALYADLLVAAARRALAGEPDIVAA